MIRQKKAMQWALLEIRRSLADWVRRQPTDLSMDFKIPKQLPTG